MPGLTLSEIVSSALSKGESSLKLASARDAEPAGDPGSFLDELLPPTKVASSDTPYEGDDEKNKDKKREKKEEKEETKESAMADIDFAFKLADALEVGSGIVTKIATGTVHDAPGPQVTESGFISTTTASPKATAKVTDRFSGGKLHPAGQETNMGDFSSPGDESGAPKNEPGKTAGWTKDKTASAAMLRAKLAQAEALTRAGLTEQAEALLGEIKAAQDPSSPPPSMPAHSDSFKLDTEPGASTHIGDNASLISMTRAQARDATTRETTKHFSEPPKKDPAVGAHTLSTDGQKVSSLKHAVSDRWLAEKLTKGLQNAGSVTAKVMPGVTRKSMEMSMGQAKGMGRGFRKELFSSAADSVRARAGGRLNQLKEAPRLMREAAERGAAGAKRDFIRATQKTSSDTAARAFVKKAFDVYNDENAPLEERQKAASILSAIKDRLGVDPSALLG